MRNFYLRYPWESCLGEFSLLPVIKWSSTGVLRLPTDWKVSASSASRIKILKLTEGNYVFSMPETKEQVSLRLTDATGREKEVKLEPPRILQSEKNFRDLPLYQSVLAWSSFFDECLEVGQEEDGRDSWPTWSKIKEKLEEMYDNSKDPQMSLIVRIADQMSKTLEVFERGMRRVLARDRRLMSADKAEEFDSACIDWYVRQPGFTAAEKAAYNQQRLKTVTRKEFVDTLENRVLKDFLRRCSVEAENYWQFLCTKEQQLSQRARMVRKFGRLCDSLLSAPIFEDIMPICGLVQPNYVLQGDLRYRRIWRFYQLLLRKQRVADMLWAWQGRLWADVATVGLNVVLFGLMESSKVAEVSLVAEGVPTISFEQQTGQRFLKKSQTGPFLIHKRSHLLKDDYIMEIVSSEELPDFLDKSNDWARKGLEIIYGATLVLFTPIEHQGRGQKILVFWPVHSEADGGLNVGEALSAMEKSVLSLSKVSQAQVQGFALVSSGIEESNRNLAHIRCLGLPPTEWAFNLLKLQEEIGKFLGTLV